MHKWWVFLGVVYQLMFCAQAQSPSEISYIDSVNHLPYAERIKTHPANINLYLKVLELAEKNQYTLGIADSYTNLGLIYFYLGTKSDQSIAYMLKAIQIYEAIHRYDRAAYVYGLYGYGMRSRDLKRAEYFMRLGIQLAEKQNEQYNLMALYDNYGVIKDDMQQLDSARYFYQKALEMKIEQKDSLGIPYSLNKLGMLELELGHFPVAKKHFDQAYELRLLLKDSIGIAENLNFYGQYFEVKNMLSQAFQYYEQSYQLSRTAGYTLLAKRNLFAQSQILEKEKEFQKALEYFKLYTSYNDSLNNAVVLAHRNELEIAFETEKKENEILTQRAELAESSLAHQKKNIIITLVLSLLLISIIIGFQFYHSQKRKTLYLEEQNQLKEAWMTIETQKQLAQQRIKISRDLHDNIGAQLTFIISSLDNLRFFLKNQNSIIDKKLSEISLFTQNTILELRDTIWAMNKGDISLEDLQMRISNFINTSNSIVGNIHFSFQIDDQLSQTHLNALEGMNIYRTLQEAVNNAVKHSNAQNISIRFSSTVDPSSRLQIDIQDDGMGFDTSDITYGNGLFNIKKRIEEINGTFQILSTIGVGTSIQILI